MPKSFLSIDSIEENLGKLVVDMSDWDLIAYLKKSMQALYGIEMAVSGRAEPSIMQGLQRTYGRQEAGLIIKWVVWRYHCRDCANPGQYVKFTSFASGRRWWTDLMHAEMQQQMAKEDDAVIAPPTTMISSAKFV